MVFEHTNLSDKVADHIALKIAVGDFPTGGRIYENDICQELSISRVPVREAFKTLQAQGLLQAKPNKGSYVSAFGSREYQELQGLRAEVEKLAFERIVEMPNRSEKVQDLYHELENLREVGTKDDILPYFQADLGFHSKAVELSESVVLISAWSSLSRGVLRCLMQENRPEYDREKSIKDHEHLIDLVAKGGRRKLQREIERHVCGNPG